MWFASCSACTRDHEKPLDRIELLLEEGNSDVARQILFDKKLDLTPRGAHLLVASFRQERRFVEAVGAVKTRQEKFTSTERTNICAAAIDALSNEQDNQSVDELFNTCEPMVDVQRVDYATLKFALKHDATANPDMIEWFALADRLSETKAGLPADVTARVLIELASQVASVTEEDARGERLVAFLEHLDAVPLRLDLIAWQIGQLAALPEQQARSCIRMLENSSAPLIAEDEDIKAAFDAAKALRVEIADDSGGPEDGGYGSSIPVDGDAIDAEADEDEGGAQEREGSQQERPVLNEAGIADASDSDARVANAAGLGEAKDASSETPEDSVACPLPTFDQAFE